MDTTAASTGGKGEFFRLIPLRARIVFFSAVFFMFAPVGLLFVSSFAERRPWTATLFYAFASGAVAVCWAGTFTLSRWFIPGVVVFSLALATVPMTDVPVSLGDARPSLGGTAVVAAIVLGYVLFVIFISGQGQTTLRLRTEMALAGRIHEALVPPLDHSDDRIEVLGVSVTSSEMGGDLVDLWQKGERTDLFLADVSGHGVGAGVVMGMLKSAIRTGLLGGSALDELLERLNTVLEETTREEVFATLVALRVHEDRSLEFASAGHHPILLCGRDTAEVQKLEDRGQALGMLPRRSYTTRTIRPQPGDLLAVYTDGMNETFDRQERELGHGPIERTIAEHRVRPLDEIRRAVFDLVERHGPQTDDRSLLLVRFKGHLPAEPG